MSLPTSEPLPEDPARSSRARRRRERRMIVPLGAGERAAQLDDLAQRTTPSFDFFLFSLLAGAVFGVGILLDAPAIFLLGALLAPFMAPVIGLSLATVVGSLRFFFQTLAGALVGAALVFAGGALAGLGLRIWPGLALDQARYFSAFSWPNFAILSLGTLLTTVSLARSEEKPVLPSVALTYGLYIPLSVAGFGLTGAVPHLWPDGLVVAVVYLSWSVLLGAITLALLKFRPLTFFGYTLGTAIALASLVLLVGLSGVGAAFQKQVALPKPAPSATPTPSQAPSPSATPPAATPTLTPTHTLIPSQTPTKTITPSPTPAWARISAPRFDGAVIRAEPSLQGRIVKSLVNGSLVQVLPGVTEADNVVWAHVLTEDGVEGWIVQALLVTATPAPGW